MPKLLSLPQNRVRVQLQVVKDGIPISCMHENAKVKKGTILKILQKFVINQE